MKTLRTSWIRSQLEKGLTVDVTIVDKDNDCCISMGYGYMPDTVLVEHLDEFGIVMEDEMLSIKEANNLICKHSDEDLYEIGYKASGLEIEEEIQA